LDLKISGTVIDILDAQSGTSQRGEWRKQEFILEVPGEYPRQICIVQWGDNIDRFGLQKDQTVTVHIDLQSREYNGRWYTDVKAWKVEQAQAADQDQAPPAPQAPQAPPPSLPASSELDDDLPF